MRESGWIAPFYLEPAIVPSLHALITIGTNSPAAHRIASLATAEAESYLTELAQHHPSLQSFPPIAAIDLPCALPSHLYSSLATSLAIRRSSSHPSASLLTFRFVLTSLLSSVNHPFILSCTPTLISRFTYRQYFGNGHFCQQVRRDSQFTYSRDEGDDTAISRYWKHCALEPESDDEVEQADGVRDGQASILRKDEKLRRVLGTRRSRSTLNNAAR